MFIITKYKNKVLCFTSHSFLVSYLYYVKYSTKNIHEINLSYYLLSTYVVSTLFWSSAKRHSLIHKIDGVVAKSSILYFIIYTIHKTHIQDRIYSQLFISYLFIVSGIFATFYLSNRESRKEWLTDKHIVYHSIFHLFCFFGSIYAFF